MKSKRNARILVLSLVVFTVYAAGWTQDGWSGVIGSGSSGVTQDTRPVHASAPLGAQRAPDQSAPISVSTPGALQESAKAGALPMAIVPFIL
jgi:hypothetical protein